MRQIGVALDAGVSERRVFVSSESENGLVHLLGVEHLELYEQVEVLNRQAGDSQEQLRFQLCDDILKRVLTEVGQVHECRDPGGELDKLFLETVTINEKNPMKVFIQLRDECEGVYVKTSRNSFDVNELRGGSSDASFMYRVVAKRKGFEQRRLDYCAAAENDPYLFPELSEKEEAERAEWRARIAEERKRSEHIRGLIAKKRISMARKRMAVGPTGRPGFRSMSFPDEN